MWWKKTALVLANIGAINWGLVQLNWNIVDKLIGSWSAGTATVVYWLVALCGIYGLAKVFQE
ncbi:DUF378 domain-containing protein [archaeon]|jgi:uncharacterized membrane protein YuzA (DUF378 family)|nr:DUF378 domain-containing protein [archaeon]MBT4373784.1 DUF378 domain-containing protein [archaeon]MBT4532250.1 DUF378 domain-containing protein [archaeon]MBT7001075.1 DUF378 domain-containing protein [archaeon]MBT7281964.1 DUF378 domain-containing protein [archaeon]